MINQTIEHDKVYIVVHKKLTSQILDRVIFNLFKKSRLLQSDSGTNSDRIATSIMNQPTGQAEHNHG